MSKSSKLCCKTSCPRSNIFCTLMDRTVKGLTLNNLRLWKCAVYEDQVYRKLATLLSNIDLEGFDILLSDYIAFVENSRYCDDINFYPKFTVLCVSTILKWVFARRGNPDLVELLLKKTIGYVKDRRCNLALIWRPFTPEHWRYAGSGIQPLHYVAETRQSNILKVLLQYGILERQENPIDTVLTVLFDPLRVRPTVDHELVDIQEDAKTCLVLCSRVLSSIPVSKIEMEISLRARPIVSNWLDYIPSTRYKDPCELVHLCRITIRAQLLSKNMLPNGIFSLLITVRLQNYLNLQS